MCDVDLEPCEIWDERRQKARKAHLCDMCRGAIRPGSEYIKHFSKFDGDITSEKMCLDCAADRDTFAKEHEGQRSSPGYMRDLIHECLYERESLPNMLKWARMLKRQQARRDQLLPIAVTR